MAERAPGFYWVKYNPTWGSAAGDQWLIAEWADPAPVDPEHPLPQWWFSGQDIGYSDEYLAEIGERVERHPGGEEVIQMLQRAIEPPAAFWTWPEPQPITDAQKTGERFLGWHTGGKAVIIETQDDGHHRVYGPMRIAAGWYAMRWYGPPASPGSGAWQIGDHRLSFLSGSVTHYLPLPPDLPPLPPADLR